MTGPFCPQIASLALAVTASVLLAGCARRFFGSGEEMTVARCMERELRMVQGVTDIGILTAFRKSDGAYTPVLEYSFIDPDGRPYHASIPVSAVPGGYTYGDADLRDSGVPATVRDSWTSVCHVNSASN
jgi:hypothetical protein